MEHQNKHGCTGMILVLYLFMIPLMLLGSGGRHVWILLYLCVIIMCVFVYTGMSVLVLVTLHVQGQVIRAREAAAAGDALEWFGSGVFPVVSGELIRSGKTPVAAFPCTTVRLLTCKREEDRTEALAIYRTFSQNKILLFCIHNLFYNVYFHWQRIQTDSNQLCLLLLIT